MTILRTVPRGVPLAAGDRAAVIIRIAQRTDGATRFSAGGLSRVVLDHMPHARSTGLASRATATGAEVQTAFAGDARDAFSSTSLEREMKLAMDGHPFAVAIASAPPASPLETMLAEATELARTLSPVGLAAAASDAAGRARDAAQAALGKVGDTIDNAISTAGTVGIAYVLGAVLVAIVVLVVLARVLPMLLSAGPAVTVAA